MTTSYRQVPANEYGVYGGHWTDDPKQAAKDLIFGSGSTPAAGVPQSSSNP